MLLGNAYSSSRSLFSSFLPLAVYIHRGSTPFNLTHGAPPPQRAAALLSLSLSLARSCAPIGNDGAPLFLLRGTFKKKLGRD